MYKIYVKVSPDSNEYEVLLRICYYFNYWSLFAMGHLILVHRMENIQNIWRKSITNNSCTTHATHTTHATLLQSCNRLNYSLRMAQTWPIMTHDDWVWQGMIYQRSGGLQGVQGGVRRHQGAPGASRLLPMPKWVIKQQNNGSKPWLKVPQVCPDPKGMVYTHFWSIWGHWML